MKLLGVESIICRLASIDLGGWSIQHQLLNMPQESLETKYRWLQNEFDGAVALIVLTVVFVSLRCVGLGYLDWRSRRTVSFGWEEALLVGSLLVFVPMCICAIGKYV